MNKRIAMILTTILLGAQRWFGKEINELEAASREHLMNCNAILRRIRQKAYAALARIEEQRQQLRKSLIGEEQGHE